MMQITFLRRTSIPILAAVSASFVGMMVISDKLTASREGYSFYFSESLLFSTLWLYFLPVALVMNAFLKRNAARDKMMIPRYAAMVCASIILHMLLYATGIYFLSLVLLDHQYHVVRTIGYTFSSDLPVYTLVYAALAVFHHHKFRPHKAVETSRLLRIPVTDGKLTTMLESRDILYIQSADSYVSIHTKGRRYLQKVSLREMEEKLGEGFLRVHRSAIINLDEVQSLRSRGNGDHDITMSDQQVVRMSRNYVQRFRHRMGSRSSA